MLFDAVASAADILWPRKCLVCGRILLGKERSLCIRCLSDLPLTGFPAQSRNPMSAVFNRLVRDGSSGSYSPYSYAAALFYYGKDGDGYSSVTKALKYNGDVASGRLFASMLAREMARSPHWSDLSGVVPVPLHWTRRWKRGYNQASVIGSEIAREFGIPLERNLLRRVRRTASQATLSTAEKAQNVEAAFKASCPSEEMRHIVIVDDVFTTGSTLYACWKALREVTPPDVRISVVTLAVVQERLPE